MNWVITAARDWVQELCEERGFSEEVRKATYALLERLYDLAQENRLDLPEPSVQNEPVSLAESARESVPALTWIGNHVEFQLMYLDKTKKTILNLHIATEKERIEEPTDEQILAAFRKIGVKSIGESHEQKQKGQGSVGVHRADS